jgi:hypothetical protein
MRKAENLNLEWDQVNLEEGFIRIEAQRSKNRKVRDRQGIGKLFRQK